MLYEKVIQTSRDWEGSERLMYVVGATKQHALKNIRDLIPNSFLLIPGVGAQGGSLTEVAENGLSERRRPFGEFISWNYLCLTGKRL